MKFDWNAIETVSPEIDHLLVQISEHLEDKPSGEDLDACDEFLKRNTELWNTLINWLGKLEAEFAKLMYETVKNLDDKTFKRIGRSSTLTTKYVEGINMDLTNKLFRCRSLVELLKQETIKYCTLLATFRDHMKVNSYKARKVEFKIGDEIVIDDGTGEVKIIQNEKQLNWARDNSSRISRV